MQSQLHRQARDPGEAPTRPLHTHVCPAHGAQADPATGGLNEPCVLAEGSWGRAKCSQLLSELQDLPGGGGNQPEAHRTDGPPRPALTRGGGGVCSHTGAEGQERCIFLRIQMSLGPRSHIFRTGGRNQCWLHTSSWQRQSQGPAQRGRGGGGSGEVAKLAGSSAEQQGPPGPAHGLTPAPQLGPRGGDRGAEGALSEGPPRRVAAAAIPTPQPQDTQPSVSSQRGAGRWAPHTCLPGL